MNRLFFTISTILILYAIPSYSKNIKVRNQHDFDNLQILIDEEVSKGTSAINVDLKKQKYHFSEGHIVLNGINNPDLSISINCNGATLTSSGEKVGDLFAIGKTYLTKEGNYYSPWSKMYQSKDTVEIVDLDKKICRLWTDVIFENKEHPKDKYIRITCWYVTKVCPVIKMDGGFIYFNASDYCRYRALGGYNINMDYAYNKSYPRYQLYGFNDIATSAYQCESSNFITLSKCRIKSFCLKGAAITGSNQEKPLVQIDSFNAERISFVNNIFSAIGNTVIECNESDNLRVENNHFIDLRRSGIIIDNLSHNACIKLNSFKRCGVDMANTLCIAVSGSNFMIANNILEDFSSCGIGAGIHYKQNEKCSCYGSINRNEIFFTDDYANTPEQYLLMDSGGIYLWTKTEGIEIKNNYLHDLTGMCDNRGIFCDDGVKNVTITENVIQRIRNSYCIDLRKVSTVESFVPDYNTGNTCTKNLIDGDIRFYLRDKTCKCIDNLQFGQVDYKKHKAYKYWKNKINHEFQK